MKSVVVVIGAGQIGQAIARRVAAGKHVVLADLQQSNADAAAEVLGNAGYDVSVATVDVSSRDAVRALVATATRAGDVTGLIHAAGVSPSQASPATILKVDLYGTALVLEEFGNVIASGGAGVVIASQSGHRLPPLSVEQNKALATTPVEELLSLPFLQPGRVTDSLHAYQLAKRGNSLRVMAEAVRWGRRGARINTISPGIIITPLAKDELAGPRGDGYRRMIELSAAGRPGTPDEVGTVGALLMGPDGGFITGSDFLMDGGVTAAYWYGALAPDPVERIDPRSRLGDVASPAQVRSKLTPLLDYARSAREKAAQGGGGVALFHGPSGTGKTLAAFAIARELGTQVWRIDLANVVSKYIGETEKNLAAVFDDAEQAGAVLLMDEADALFGKRSEVRDSHDRYANIEVSYLLQRIESFNGIVILTTNKRQSMDEAFVRRLRFVIEFPMRS